MKQLMFVFLIVINCSTDICAMQPQSDSKAIAVSQKLSQFGRFHFERGLVPLTEVKNFLQQGADPNVLCYDYKVPPLVFALAYDKQDMVKALLEAGASVDEAFKSIATRSCNCFCGVLKELVGRGANVNQDVRDGMTALMYSTTRDMGRTEELMALGANPNIVDKEGDSALIMAVKNGRAFSVLALVTRKRTDRTIKNKAGESAIELARANVMIERLFARPADKD